ncbi:unnamed protein product, partial [Candidula unifasciata]
MGEFTANSGLDRWVCPNDRQLSLRAKLGTGWSVHTNRMGNFTRPDQLSLEEQEQILNVINRAEFLEGIEQERIGRLVDKLDNMKKNAVGNGSSQCILCGDEFKLLGASPSYCDDCAKAVCSKCGMDTISSCKQPLWLCKICAETREVWKRSGAWFFKGLPKYVLPEKKTESGKYPMRMRASPRGSVKGRPAAAAVAGSASPKDSYTWHKARGSASTGVSSSYGESSEQDSSESSEEDFSMTKQKVKKSVDSESDNLSMGSTASRTAHNNHSRVESKASSTNTNNQASQLSATESSRGDNIRDETESERSSTY